jgi:hypothetical protein
VAGGGKTNEGAGPYRLEYATGSYKNLAVKC